MSAADLFRPGTIGIDLVEFWFGVCRTGAKYAARPMIAAHILPVTPLSGVASASFRIRRTSSMLGCFERVSASMTKGSPQIFPQRSTLFCFPAGEQSHGAARCAAGRRLPQLLCGERVR